MKNIIFLSMISCTAPKRVLNHVIVSDSFKGFDKSQKIVLVPLVNEKFEMGSNITFDLIAKQLKNSGWNAVTLSKENYLSLRADIAKSVGGIYSPITGEIDLEKKALARSRLLQSINNNSDFSAVLIPEFSLRTAKLEGRSAKWDGSKRKMITNGKVTSSGTYSGSTKGLSLRITAYDGNGKWAFTSYGGLVLLFEAKIGKSETGMVLRENVFQKLEDLESGVNVALFPLIEK